MLDISLEYLVIGAGSAGHYHRDELVTTLHLSDYLEDRWTRPDLHVEPLESLFA
ncbi:hypothetical protein ACFU6K_03440 [Kitasatospora sp. NPDC057512]|uniref:hypothetical protein n=1 Tax=Kitasatospora sp. NPDC057512 TaxID=3346154 RepID=UPI0036BF1AFC